MASDFLWSDIWAGGLIGFREAVEAALIIGVLLTWLARSERGDLANWIWKGVGAGVLASLVVAALFAWIWGGVESFNEHEAMFEGILELTAAALLTAVIIHFIRHPSAAELEEWADEAYRTKQGAGLFMISFLSVWREGSETVIFIGAGTEGSGAILGVLIGILMASVLAFGFFKKGLEVDIKKLFKVTNVLLILFAAGLVAHGFHELQEAGAAPIVVEHIWDVNPDVSDADAASGNYPALHEKGVIGGIFKALFGWNGNPALLEVVLWVAYVTGMVYLSKKLGGSNNTSE
uniref:High-affinity iron transporter (FTR, efeU) n=3 Tax=environmental samples TaxID=68359 RepID=A0A075HEL9_9EURY|nr:high-affinity iron transporter (FTR, efeU) [uncultured marine group II/III euryarchaeote KM3_151_F02]AIF14936.1 high-affinity iron transporter (FTR, efeU) [uncultured marine group II/III euryarchaeote KM3_68_H12]AIF18489.1 high-affinity iron transporter (FTR, efeU) [uncultured marine group II/III euryarchaeote KM3_83_B05]